MGDTFVTPAVQRLTLSTGDTIDIIKRLNHGETEDMYARFLEKRGSVRTVLILTYLVGWSLTRDGTPVPYSPMLSEQERTDTIRNLDPDVAAEIHQAIEAHEAGEDRKRADAKKKTAGAAASAATSPSPSIADGPSAMSAPLAWTSTTS